MIDLLACATITAGLAIPIPTGEIALMHLGLAQGLVPTNPDDLTPELARDIAALGVTRLMTHFELPRQKWSGRVVTRSPICSRTWASVSRSAPA